MNISDKENIKIRDKLFARASAEICRKRLLTSDLARGMYCASMISCMGKGNVLCVFLDKSGKVCGEVMLNRDFGKLHDRIISKLTDCAKRFSSETVFIGRPLIEADDLDYIIAGGILIGSALKKNGITLLGYYLKDGPVCENILP